MEGTTYSSATLKIHDAAIHDKYAKQIENLESRIQRLKHANDAQCRKVFDATNMGESFARSLGFQSLNEAHVAIDTAPENRSYSETLSLVEQLQDELDHARLDNETLHTQRKRFETHKQMEFEALQQRYDDLLASHQRAALRYKSDFQRYKDTRDWITKQLLSIPEDNVEDLQRMIRKLRRRFSKSAEEGEANAASVLPLMPDFDNASDLFRLDKENAVVPPKTPTRKEAFTPVLRSSPLTNNADKTLVGSTRPRQPPKGKQPVILAPNSSLSDADLGQTVIVDASQAEEALFHSETEDDSPSRFVAPIPETTNAASDTDEDNPFVHSSSPASTPTKPSQSLHPSSVFLPPPAIKSEVKLNLKRLSGVALRPEKPAKVRRVSEGNSESKQQATPINKPGTSNAVAGSSKQAAAGYSGFKGRGRYAKYTATEHKTINQQFEINAEKNDGLKHQFDEVVRNKAKRKQMDADDCECCRDYYEAIGPMPARLQAPAWRSPTTSPVKPCAQHHTEQRTVVDHKKAISRHRHNWARAKTPPGYWDIGFPDTQEAEKINAKATRMHEQKERDIAQEAQKDNGRYRKR